MLQNFLGRIDFEAVKRIKNRLFVVGRFNDHSPGDFPDLFLFKHPNRTISDAYASNFTAVGDMTFRSFLDQLKPSVYEVVEESTQKGRFTQVKMLPPSQVSSSGKRAHGKYSLNELNWFIIRSFATTLQPAFLGKHPNMPKELLTDDPTQRGREIYKLIRRSLADFAKFQPQTYKVVEAFGGLFGEIGAYEGLPAFGEGNALPPGFPEALIDYLYSEDIDKRFSLDNVDTSADEWAQLNTSRGNASFCTAVSAFRDEVVGKSTRQHNSFRLAGRSIHDLVVDKLDSDLVREFRTARDSFIGLRQILRGKVLISMVLQWVLLSLDEIRDVKALGPKALPGPKDRVKGRAVLERWKENGLAKPITRASRSERRRFSRELKKSFDVLLNTVLAFPETLKKLGEIMKTIESGKATQPELDDLHKRRAELESEVPKELLETPDILQLAITLAADEKRMDLLRGLTNRKLGEDYKRSFINAAKILLTDVLCPTLFQDPIFTKDQLRRFFRAEMMTVYLMAVFLDDKTKDETVRVAEAYQGEFQEYVDPLTKLIRDPGKLQSKLLNKFVDILTRDELGTRLDKAELVLSEAYTVRENTPDQMGDGKRVSRITAWVPDEIYRRALENDPASPDPASAVATDLPDSDLLSVVERIAYGQAEEAIRTQMTTARAKSKAASDAKTEEAQQSESNKTESHFRSTDSGPGNSGADEPTESAASKEAPPSDAEKPERSVTEQDISLIVADIVSSLPEESFAFEGDVDPSVLEGQAKAVATEATRLIEERHQSATSNPTKKDKPVDILQNMKDNMRAFQSALFLIYQRYNENQDKRDFKNNVDRFTLVNLMLLFQNELGLGDVHSSLMHLLLDLVLHMDADNPDPKTFLEERSLTVYFDNDLVDPAGMTSLRQVLEMQTRTNLQSMISLVSELMGIRHLIEAVSHDKDAEVIVVNATAREFKQWIEADNLNVKKGAKSRLNPFQIVSTHTSEKCIPPGLVYLSDAAFDYDFQNKLAFLGDLAGWELSFQGVSVVIPPLCVSTSRQSEDWSDRRWYDEEGISLKDAVVGAPCPVFVVGPSSFLNAPGDAYGTFIPAGYVFGAHFLSRPYQGLRNDHVQREGVGRFFTLGYGNVETKESLGRVIWGRSKDDTCSFASDFYLYIILFILSSAVRAGAALPQALDWPRYYDCFHNTVPELLNRLIYDSSHAISPALWGAMSEYPPREVGNTPKPAYHYAMAERISQPGTPFKTALLQPPGRDLWLSITDVGWFDRARGSAKLP